MKFINGMTKRTGINQLTPGRTVAFIAAALVLSIAELTFVGILFAAMAMGIAHVFASVEHSQEKAMLLVIASIVAMTGSMIAIASRNVPFLCKQAGVISMKAAPIFAIAGAFVWTMAAVFICITADGDVSIGNIPILAGLLGGAALQLFMGCRRYSDVDSLSAIDAANGLEFDSTNQPAQSIENLLLQNAPVENSLEGGTITLPTAEEIKQEL